MLGLKERRKEPTVKLFTPLECALVSALGIAPIVIAACSGDDGETGSDHDHDHDHDPGDGGDPYADRPPVCHSIIDACHTKDPGLPGEVNTCHEAGHDGTEAECQAAVDDGCIETCNNAPSVTDGG